MFRLRFPMQVLVQWRLYVACCMVHVVIAACCNHYMGLSLFALVQPPRLMAYADCVGAAGAVMNLPDGHFTTTLESKTNFFSGGLGPVLNAVSIPLHVGRTTMVWQTTISNSGDGSRVAIVTQTQIVIPLRKPA